MLREEQGRKKTRQREEGATVRERSSGGRKKKQRKEGVAWEGIMERGSWKKIKRKEAYHFSPHISMKQLE